MSAPLLSLAEDTALLALEAQTVIGIRLTQLSLGGSAAGAEAQRMVTEKVSAFAEAAALLASGGSAHEVVKGYRAGQAPDGVAVVNGSVNVLEVKRRVLRSETAQVRWSSFRGDSWPPAPSLGRAERCCSTVPLSLRISFD